MISHIFHRYNFVYVVLCIVAILQAHVFYTISQAQGCKNPKALIAFLDVGQGDAIYIQDTYGKSVLIDTGPKDNSVIEEVKKVTGCSGVHINTLLLTHPDADHIGEAKKLIDKDLVDELIHNGFIDIDQPDETLMENELEQTIGIKRKVAAGERIYLQDIDIDILYPIQPPYLTEMATTTTSKRKKKINIDDNIYSIVTKVTYTGKDKKTFLLTGDASVSVEDNMIKTYGDTLQSDVLKLGHHGSKSSSGQKFLDIVSPEEVIVSAAKNNRYNHPSAETMERVYEQRRKKSLKIRETYVEGNIVYPLE